MLKCLKWCAIIFVVLLVVPLAYMFIGCTSAKKDSTPPTESPITKQIRQQIIADHPNYIRDEARTYLTFPEWYIVYISQDYGHFLKSKRPSAFPYFSAAFDFWTCYCGVTKLTSSKYPTSWDAHIMIYVIGVSHTAEYLLKGVYENTFGRVFEWLSFDQDIDEEVYAQKVASEYGQFLNTTPWYEYNFTSKLSGLWRETSFSGWGFLRKFERKLMLSAEYGFKALYGGLIKFATGTVYAPAHLKITMVTSKPEQSLLDENEKIELNRKIGDNLYVMTIPRYLAFTKLIEKFSDKEVKIFEIAGNDEILVTALMPTKKGIQLQSAQELFNMSLPSKPGFIRIGLQVELQDLGRIVRSIKENGGIYEHSYDY